MILDWQIIVVSLAVLAAAAYVLWRARETFAVESASGSCSGCERGEKNDENAPKVKPLVQLDKRP